MTKTTTALVLMIQALTLSLAVASEGGGGHNGPDFKGTSIDLAFDRTISRGEMLSILGRCLKITATDTLAAILKDPTLELDFALQSPNHRGDDFFIDTSIDTSNEVKGSIFFHMRKHSEDSKDYYDSELQKDDYELSVKAIHKFSDGKTSVRSLFDLYVAPGAYLTVVGFPFVEFKSDKNFGFTDLGVKVLSSEPVTEIKLYDQPGVDSYSLYNGDHKLDYTVNGRKYVDCIKASL